MWTSEHRRAANRNGLRYPSDLTDDEWALVAPDDPAGETGWTQTLSERARSLEWDLLRPLDRMPVEGIAERPAAEEHGARLSGALELGRHVGAHQSRIIRGGAGAGRT